MEKCCDACGDGKYYFRSGFMALHGDGDLEATTAGDRQSTGHTLGELVKNADFLCISCTWRLWKSVVTLAVTGNTISGRVFRRYKVTVFQRHRLPLNGG
jgi:hypothetical protein